MRCDISTDAPKHECMVWYALGPQAPLEYTSSPPPRCVMGDEDAPDACRVGEEMPLHDSNVLAMVYSQDLDALITASQDTTIRIHWQNLRLFFIEMVVVTHFCLKHLQVADAFGGKDSLTLHIISVVCCVSYSQTSANQASQQQPK